MNDRQYGRVVFLLSQISKSSPDIHTTAFRCASDYVTIQMSCGKKHEAEAIYIPDDMPVDGIFDNYIQAKFYEMTGRMVV